MATFLLFTFDLSACAASFFLCRIRKTKITWLRGRRCQSADFLRLDGAPAPASLYDLWSLASLLPSPLRVQVSDKQKHIRALASHFTLCALAAGDAFPGASGLQTKEPLQLALLLPPSLPLARWGEYNKKRKRGGTCGGLDLSPLILLLLASRGHLIQASSSDCLSISPPVCCSLFSFFNVRQQKTGKRSEKCRGIAKKGTPPLLTERVSKRAPSPPVGFKLLGGCGGGKDSPLWHKLHSSDTLRLFEKKKKKFCVRKSKECHSLV